MSDLVLTPEADAEVKRNLFAGFGVIGACLILTSLLLAVVINPPGSDQGYRFASLLLIAFCFPMLAMAATCVTLAYPMGCWPGFLRNKRLATLYGIDADEVSKDALREWMKRPAYWMAFAKGCAVGSVFIAPWFFGTWAMNRDHFPEGYVFPAIWLVLYSGGLAGKSLVVRQLVGARPSTKPIAE